MKRSLNFDKLMQSYGLRALFNEDVFVILKSFDGKRFQAMQDFLYIIFV